LYRDNHAFTTGLYFTTNNGNSWDSIINIASVGDIKGNANYIFAANSNLPGIIRSSDEGITWNPTTINRGVWCIEVSGNYLFAGTEAGVYVSSDNGNNWIEKNEGLTGLNNNKLMIANDFIFAGIRGKSLFRRPFSEIAKLKNINQSIPEKFKLYQNYPNPFNPITKIQFSIPGLSNQYHFKGMNVKLVIYNSLGQEVEMLLNRELNPGEYEVEWDGSNMASGIYYFTLSVNDIFITRKMVLIK
jgi:hypothetical protein